MDNALSLPATRAEAVNNKVSHYFTGKPCKHGHVSPRRTNDRMCLECCRVRSAKHYADNKVAILEAMRNAPVDLRGKINGERRKRYSRDIEASRERLRQRRRENPDAFKSYDRKHRRKPGVRLHRAISEGVRRSLRAGGKAGRSTFDILGFSLKELKQHIQKQFDAGMTWDNYGEWEIDHKVPRVVHNFETSEDIDFKKCWALGNLRPLWRHENRSKGGRITAGFQPSLALSLPATINQKATT